MPSKKITIRSVEAVQAGSKDSYLWDTELKGFGLKVTPSGARIYLVQYRTGGRGGRTRRVTLGRHGSPWTPDQARAEAKRVLGAAAAGADPAEEKTLARKDLTVAELCDLYLEEGTAIKKATTVAMDRSRIESHVKPLLGRAPLRSVSRGDVERFLQDVAKGKTRSDRKTGPRGRSVVKGGKGAATRTVGMLGAIFEFATHRGLCEANPVRGVKRFPDGKSERFLSPAELARLGSVLSHAEEEGFNATVTAAIRLLMLTGTRKGEVLSLTWDQVDFDHKCLRLPETKTGAKTIPLGAPALELLEGLPRSADNPHVFPSATGEGSLVGLQKYWAELRARAGLDDVRIHDLRHSFASVAVAGGDSLYLVGKILGHKQARSAEVYAHLADDPIRAVADRASMTIAAALHGSRSEVVNLSKKRH